MTELNPYYYPNIEIENEMPKEKENKPLKQEIKVIFKDFLETTPIHALPFIARSKSWFMRIFWIFFFCALFGFGVYLVVKALMDYYDYPVVSEVQENIERQPEFPAITICNLDPFITSYAADYVEKRFLDLSNFTKEELLSPTSAIFYKLSNARRFILNEINNPSISLTNKRKFGYSLEETLIDCHYNNENCKNTTDDDFVWHFSYNYGNCYTYNSGFKYELNENPLKKSVPKKVAKKPGSLFGLNLEIFTGVADSLYSLKNYGAIVFIHNQTSLPETSSGILLKPGTHSDIVVKKSFSSLVPSPYSDCQNLDLFDFDRTLYDILDAASITYNQQDCLDLCMQQEIIRKCGCYYMEFLRLNNTNPCLSEEELECASIIYDSFAIQESTEKCEAQCPLECESLKYDFTISTAGNCFFP